MFQIHVLTVVKLNDRKGSLWFSSSRSLLTLSEQPQIEKQRSSNRDADSLRSLSLTTVRTCILIVVLQLYVPSPIPLQPFFKYIFTYFYQQMALFTYIFMSVTLSLIGDKMSKPFQQLVSYLALLLSFFFHTTPRFSLSSVVASPVSLHFTAQPFAPPYCFFHVLLRLKVNT